MDKKIEELAMPFVKDLSFALEIDLRTKTKEELDELSNKVWELSEAAWQERMKLKAMSDKIQSGVRCMVFQDGSAFYSNGIIVCIGEDILSNSDYNMSTIDILTASRDMTKMLASRAIAKINSELFRRSTNGIVHEIKNVAKASEQVRCELKQFADNTKWYNRFNNKNKRRK